ncbi:MAG: hypothetical protein RRZ93_08815, partial [Ruthenibacterium sp.]
LNIFLFASLASRNADARNAQQQARTELSALFAQEGITLSPALKLPESPSALLTLSRDTAEDAKLASALLGTVSEDDEGGGIYRYRGENGTALFRSGGAFDLTMDLSVENPEAYCNKFFKAFDYRDTVVSLADGSGTITATQYFQKRPVVNATVTFSFLDGRLYSVVGHHFPAKYSSETPIKALSALSALSCFLQKCKETDADRHSVHSIAPGFSLQSTPATPLALVPVWCI